MSDDPVTTRITVVDEGEERELHFQEYWVRRRAADEVKSFRFDGVDGSVPAPGVLEAVSDADVVVVCPSNPVVSVGPILAVPGVREAVAARRSVVVGVSPIVGGAPIAGMADKLMPIAGLEVSALGAARAYDGLLGGWVIDEADRALADGIAGELGIRVAVTDTIMRDDGVSEALARTALDLVAR
jgi:LPPG:FO 2-phospho-L-lactate transferase